MGNILRKIRKVLSKEGPGLVKKRVKDEIKFSVAPRLLRPYFRLQLRRREVPPKFLFVLSPMRSGSTLLTHILNGHPEISGSIEHGANYKSLGDLGSLISRVAIYNANYDVSHQQYFLDKMVWNYLLDPSILASEHSRFIFLVREPEANFASIARLIPELRDSQKALDYYARRLDYLRRSAEAVNDPRRCLLVHYEDLLDDTEAVLEQLRTFLSVGSPFSENYTPLKETGTLKYGDNSNRIRTGTILRDKGLRDRGARENFFSASTLEEATLHYKAYLRALEQRCWGGHLRVAERS